jgi:hypothetical protein
MDGVDGIATTFSETGVLLWRWDGGPSWLHLGGLHKGQDSGLDVLGQGGPSGHDAAEVGWSLRFCIVVLSLRFGAAARCAGRCALGIALT